MPQTGTLVHLTAADLRANPEPWRGWLEDAYAYPGAEADASTLWARLCAGEPSFAALACVARGRVLGLIVVQRHDDPTLQIVAAAGRGLTREHAAGWWRLIEAVARANGAARIIAEGRPEWARLTGMVITGRTARGAARMEARLDGE